MEILGERCIVCEKQFEKLKDKKTFGRYKVETVASPYTFGKVFPSMQVSVDAFICTKCFECLRLRTVPKKSRGHRKSMKRQWPVTPKEGTTGCASKSPYRKKARCTTPKSKIHNVLPSASSVNKASFTNKVCTAIEAYNYLKAFRILVHASPRAKSALMKLHAELIKEERKIFVSTPNNLSKPLSLESLESFSWQGIMQDLEIKCPTMLYALKSMFPEAKKVAHQRVLGPGGQKMKQTLTDAKELINVRIGTAAAIALFSSKPSKSKFLQTAMSVELWRQGSTLKTFRTLNRMGITLSVGSARSHVDNLMKQHDRDILQWKAALESKPPEKESKPPVRRRLSMPPKEMSYGVCWDNVQIDVHTKHQAWNGQNQMLMWGMTFAVNHRVNTTSLTSTESVPASCVPVTSFLPSTEDFQALREEMTVAVIKILARNMPSLHGIKVSSPRHIYSDVMNERSEIVNLGVVEANPASTDGCLEIMKHLHNYVPKSREEGSVTPILCSGDGLSIERMIHAHMARSNGRTQEQRLEGLVESPQEFHKEILLIQDYMNTFFKGNSISARGTIAQLKSFFRHKSLKKDVKTNVQHSWDMMEFCTDAYVVLFAMKVLNTNSINHLPSQCPSNPTDKKLWLEKIARDIVDFCWLPTPNEELIEVGEGIKSQEPANGEGIFPYCCLEDKCEEMVKCCSWLCSHSWFHLSCVGLTECPPEAEDWFCSKSCAEDQSYIYCTCHQRKGGEMIQCSLKEKCKRHEWYHLSCIHRETSDTWFCSEDCELDCESDDHVLNYSKDIMWSGLNIIVRRDAVRNGNGPGIIRHWKLDLERFWSLGHYKYLVIAHQMLANIGGALPERLRQDLIWNRVANVKGREGGNVGLDLVNEFLNNDFKEMLKHSRGRYTDQQVERCAKMGGAFGRQIDRLFTHSGLGFFDPQAFNARPNRYRDDIAIFTQEYQQDALFDYIPGRNHQGFNNFSCYYHIRKPWQFGQKLQKLSSKMDRWKQVIQH